MAKKVPAGVSVRVRGLVQGVGFRPHVWQLAHQEGLAGRVLNDSAGVLIDAWGKAEALDRFIARLQAEPPPLARIDAIDTKPLGGSPASGDFVIAASAGGHIHTGIVPDAATCLACLTDITDPRNRRHRYAFTNCTHCGPRLSIVEAIPYDRATTSMKVFPMCADCRREYDDPADRRFHAQPNACPACGPRLWLDGEGGIEGDPIAQAAALLRDGRIVAIKGIGGFHLACDATNEAAVARLRQRKIRDAKPLAVMVADLVMAGDYADLAGAEALLTAPAAPIVLVPAAGQALAPSIAPGHDHLGLMLPYTPLHHLLLVAMGRPLVMTSGNRAGAPQAIDNDAARVQLAEIADAWLMHDRAIINRLDDSVMRPDRPGPTVLRRARGLAPAPIRLSPDFADAPKVLAMGGELKSTFALLRDGEAILSQHLGDLEEAATHADYRRTLDLYRQLFDFMPDVIAVDRHGGYLSTQWGRDLAAETGARLIEVQHHHAHLAACLAEHGEPSKTPAIGIILDGLGAGDDGTVWGGEILIGNYGHYRRAGHFLPVALPGGAQAVREPWRNAIAHLMVALGADYRAELAGIAFADALATNNAGVIEKMIGQGINSPLSSSAGRLFDAVAALLGVVIDRQAYEGEAGMRLEALARPYIAEACPYPVARSNADPFVLSWAGLFAAILDDLRQGSEIGAIAARFHRTLIDGVADAASALAISEGIEKIVLSGGVMQNRILLEGLHAHLSAAGFTVLTHHQVPANDGGLALGQAAIAAAQALSQAGN